MTERAPLTEEEQERRRASFREVWYQEVAFNVTMGVQVLRWDPDGVDLQIPYTEALSSHAGVLHGGVVASLIDTAGAGAVLAGHDFNKGSRISTVSMTINYLSGASGEHVVAEARCTRRGRTTHFTTVDVRRNDGALIAQAIAAYLVMPQTR